MGFSMTVVAVLGMMTVVAVLGMMTLTVAVVVAKTRTRSKRIGAIAKCPSLAKAGYVYDQATGTLVLPDGHPDEARAPCQSLAKAGHVYDQATGKPVLPDGHPVDALAPCTSLAGLATCAN